MSKRTVFIVDDEKPMRRKYKKLLTENGFRVVEAPDALEVANTLMRERNSLDLILLDVNIAEVDGRDIFEIIDEYAPGMPVIVSSVYPTSEQKFRIPHSDDYFSKSQKDEILLAKVRNLLGIKEEKPLRKKS